MALSISVRANMPSYRCHKQVKAARIVSITSGDDGSKRLEVQFEGQSQTHTGLFTADELTDRPAPIKDGFYVEYDNGYYSFSPAQPFLEGYSLLQ